MTGNFLLVGANGHVSPLQHTGNVQAGLARLVSMCSARRDSQGRQVYDTHRQSLRLLHQHFDSVCSDIRRDAEALREDGFTPGLGMFNPRDLTHRFQTILEERQAPLNAFAAFGLNTEVPPGSLRYEQYRMYSTGQAVVYRGGSGAQVPAMGLGQATFSAPVV
jgi:hypothetical protein